MIELAKENDKNGTYQSIINSKIPYDDEIFDLVFASFVLLEMSSLEQIEEALTEISRVLKPYAHFVAILDNENMYKYNWGALNTNFSQNKTLENGQKVKIEFTHNNLSIEDYYWTQKTYISAMQKVNLELLEISNPLADPNNGIEWRDETHISPISIYFMKKS